MPQPDARPEPGLAIVNARVHTGDPRRPWADAVLVRGERLEAVGSSADVRKRVTAGTRVIDAKGRTVVRALPAAPPATPSPLSPAPAPLSAGSSADLQVIDGDAGSATAQVILTILEGRIVYERHED